MGINVIVRSEVFLGTAKSLAVGGPIGLLLGYVTHFVLNNDMLNFNVILQLCCCWHDLSFGHGERTRISPDTGIVEYVLI